MRKVLILALLVGLVALASVASAASLPATVVGVPHFPASTNSYLSFDLKSGGNVILPNSPPIYTGWCINPAAALQNGRTETWNVYSSLGSIPSQIPTENWMAINYILNHPGSYSKEVIQTAIWKLGGSGEKWQPVNSTQVTALINNALANPTWTPGPGDIYAVILFTTKSYQPVIIQVPMPNNPPPVPEFPTLGLPVAMLLGMVFTIYVVKRRDEY